MTAKQPALAIALVAFAILFAGCDNAGSVPETPVAQQSAEASQPEPQVATTEPDLDGDDVFTRASRSGFDVTDRPDDPAALFVYQAKHWAIGKQNGHDPVWSDFRWSDYEGRMYWQVLPNPEDNAPVLLHLEVDAEQLDPVTLSAMSSKALVTDNPQFSLPIAGEVATTLAKAHRDETYTVDIQTEGPYVVGAYHPRGSSDYASDRTMVDFIFRLRPPRDTPAEPPR